MILLALYKKSIAAPHIECGTSARCLTVARSHPYRSADAARGGRYPDRPAVDPLSLVGGGRVGGRKHRAPAIIAASLVVVDEAKITVSCCVKIDVNIPARHDDDRPSTARRLSFRHQGAAASSHVGQDAPCQSKETRPKLFRTVVHRHSGQRFPNSVHDTTV